MVKVLIACWPKEVTLTARTIEIRLKDVESYRIICNEFIALKQYAIMPILSKNEKNAIDMKK
jgi:hypothetical protein